MTLSSSATKDEVGVDLSLGDMKGWAEVVARTDSLAEVEA